MNNWKSRYGTGGEPASPRRALRGNLAARRRDGAEPATIICAVIIAAALGAASGLWLSAQWASAAASADAPAPASPTGARAAVVEPPSRQRETSNASTGADDPNASGEATASTHNVEPTQDGRDNVEPPPTDTRSASRRRTEDDDDAKANAVGTVIATERESPAEKADKNRGARTAEPRRAFGRGQGGPCRLSLNGGALTLRGGGSATLTLSLGGAGGAVTASTPDWSNIVVLSESGLFGGEAQRFAIRSVSGRPGTYSVNFRSPCGSRTVPVTVTGIRK